MASAGPSASSPDASNALATQQLPSAGYKTCSKCKEVKLAAASFWKDPTKKGGYTSWCKQCFNKSSQKRKEQGPGVRVSERECSICKIRKPADAFMKDARRITGLDARCRECRRAQHAARKQRNIESGAAIWEEKECKRCHEVKPAAMFKKHAYTTSGLDSWCKACCSERRKELLAQKALEHVGDPAAKATKECSMCNANKPLTEFARDRQQPSGYHRRCKGCEKAYRTDKRKLKEEPVSTDEEEEDAGIATATPPSIPRQTRQAVRTAASQAAGGFGRGAVHDRQHNPLAPAKAAAVLAAMNATQPLLPSTEQQQVLLQRATVRPRQAMPSFFSSDMTLAAAAAAAGAGAEVVGPMSEPLYGGSGLQVSSHDLSTATNGAANGSSRERVSRDFPPAAAAVGGNGRVGWGVVGTEGPSFNSSAHLAAEGALSPPSSGSGLWNAAPPEGLRVPSDTPAAFRHQGSFQEQQAAARVLHPPAGMAGSRKPSAFLTGADPGLFDTFLRQDSVVLPPGMHEQLLGDMAPGEQSLVGAPRSAADSQDVLIGAGLGGPGAPVSGAAAGMGNDATSSLDAVLLAAGLLSQAAGTSGNGAGNGAAGAWGRAPPVAGWTAAAGRVRTESMGVLNAATAGRNDSLREVVDATRPETVFGLPANAQGRIESLLGPAMRVDSPYMYGSSPGRMDSLLRDLYPPATTAQDVFPRAAATQPAAGTQQAAGTGLPDTAFQQARRAQLESLSMGLGENGLANGLRGLSGVGVSGFTGDAGANIGGAGGLGGYDGMTLAGASGYSGGVMRFDSLLDGPAAMEFAAAARSRQVSDVSLADVAMWLGGGQGMAPVAAGDPGGSAGAPAVPTSGAAHARQQGEGLGKQAVKQERTDGVEGQTTDGNGSGSVRAAPGGTGTGM